MQAEQQSELARFEAWAKDEGYDTANTYDTERSRWIWLNPMTADLWKCWCAALSHPSPQGWQNISTAPQDRIILIAVHHFGEDWRTFVAQADRSGDGTTWWSTTDPLGWTKLHGGWTPAFWKPIDPPPEQGSKG